MTHYFDGCRPSCSHATVVTNPIQFCGSDGLSATLDDGATSVCESGGAAATCKDQYPWIEDGVLYGFGAKSGFTGADVPCGMCYELTFSNARGIDKAVVMITNAGDSTGNNVDLMVPGGGLGEFAAGLSGFGWTDFYTYCLITGGDTDACKNTGGFTDETYCDKAFGSDTAAQAACHSVLFSVFGQLGCNDDDGYPPNLDVISSTQVTCPSALTAKAYG